MENLTGKTFRYISHFGDVMYFTVEAVIFDNGKAKVMNSNLVTFFPDEITIIN